MKRKKAEQKGCGQKQRIKMYKIAKENDFVLLFHSRPYNGNSAMLVGQLLKNTVRLKSCG